MITLSQEKINQLDTNAKRFVDALQRGVEAFKEAGRIVAEEVDKDPRFPEKIAEQTNGEISAVLVRRFEKLGRGQVIPQFMLHWDKPGVKKLMRLPAVQQEMYLKDSIEVLVSNGEILLVDPRHMTKLQAKQVFSEDEIRTPAEQRAWIESEKSRETIKSTDKADVPYTFVKGKIVFNKSCHFDVDDLMRILVMHK